MDINRNILFEDLSKADYEDIDRMNAFWGDNSWTKLLYSEQKNLFGDTTHIKIDNYQALAKEFCNRLKRPVLIIFQNRF